MEYYNPIDNSSKWYAAIVTLIVMAIIAVVVSYISLEVEIRHAELYAVEIEYIELEEEEPVEPETKLKSSTPETKVVNTNPQPKQAHEQPAPEESYNQTSGQQAQTQTVNPNALFKPTVGTTSDEDIAEGNRLAPEGDKEEHKGEGTGINVIGSAVPDVGLQQRGVLAGFPHPKGNNAEGKVVVAVVVDSDGNVLSASIKPQGTTTNDPELCKNAIQAAKRTKFKPDPERMTQSGTITYNYKIK